MKDCIYAILKPDVVVLGENPVVLYDTVSGNIYELEEDFAYVIKGMYRGKSVKQLSLEKGESIVKDVIDTLLGMGMVMCSDKPVFLERAVSIIGQQQGISTVFIFDSYELRNYAYTCRGNVPSNLGKVMYLNTKMLIELIWGFYQSGVSSFVFQLHGENWNRLLDVIDEFPSEALYNTFFWVEDSQYISTYTSNASTWTLKLTVPNTFIGTNRLEEVINDVGVSLENIVYLCDKSAFLSSNKIEGIKTNCIIPLEHVVSGNLDFFLVKSLPLRELLKLRSTQTCMAGKIAVSVRGEVFLCSSSKEQVGFLSSRTETMKFVFDFPSYRNKDAFWYYPNVCRDCGYRPLCNVCWTLFGERMFGSYEGKTCVIK